MRRRIEQKSGATSQRLTDVPFKFISDEEYDCVLGAVELRSADLVLDIEREDGSRSYLIHGRREQSHFVGRDVRRGQPEPVAARWAEIGNGEYVGTWSEGKTTYLFTFDISLEARRSAAEALRPRVDAMNRRLPGAYGTSRRR